MNDFFSKLCPAVPWEFKSNSMLRLPGEQSQNTFSLIFCCASKLLPAHFQWITSHSFCVSIAFIFQVNKWLIPTKQAAKPSQQVRSKRPNAPICLPTCCWRAHCETKCFILAWEDVRQQPHEGEHFSPDFFLPLQNITNDFYLVRELLRKAGKGNTSRPLILLW